MSDEVATAEVAAEPVIDATESTETIAEPEAPAEEAAPPPPEDKVAKRYADLARKEAARIARVEADKAERAAATKAIEEQRQALAAQIKAAEAYEQKRAKGKEDPLAFLKEELGIEFEDVARTVIAKAEPPKEPDPLEEAKAAKSEVERLREEIRQREIQQQAMAARREILADVDKNIDQFPAIKVASTHAGVRAALDTFQFGDPREQVITTMTHVYQHGGVAEIDGKTYQWPPGTELPFDVAGRMVDNVIMRIVESFADAHGTLKPQPTPAVQSAAAAETTTKPGSEAAKKPRTLSNSRASTPTSPVREYRTYASEEDEIADLVRSHGSNLFTD